MTEVKILDASFNLKRKPVQFVTAMYRNGQKESITIKSPKDYKHIELIAVRYYDGFDLMFAYNDHRYDGMLYYGHINDGFVE